MFSNFVVAVSAVIPIFVLISIGLFVKRAKLMTPEELKHTNRMVFRVFFFCMMFANIYRADFEDGFDPSLVVFGMTAVTLLFLAAMAFSIWFEKDNRKRGSMAQAIFRSNFVILGIPIVVNIFGEEAALIPTMMIAAIVPLYNIFAVFELEMFRGGKFQLIPILIRVLKNPMIDGIILGALCRLLPFPIPDPILKPIAQVGAATTPVALIILGASFEKGGIADSRRDLWASTIARLIVAPAIMLTAAALLGFRGAEFVTLIAIFATPCAVASYAMAQQMGADAALAGNCVVFTSALSAFTMFGWVFMTKTLGLF